MDITATRTGRTFHGIDTAMAALLLEQFPDQFKRVELKPAVQPTGKLNFEIIPTHNLAGANPNPPTLLIKCGCCDYNMRVSVENYKVGQRVETAARLRLDLGTITHCFGREKETVPDHIVEAWVKENKRMPF